MKKHYFFIWLLFSFWVITIAVVFNGPTSETVNTLTLNSGPLDLDVKIIITSDTSLALRYVRSNLDSTVTAEDFDSRGTTFPSIDGKSPIIWLPNADDAAVVQHELFHATIDVMKWGGVVLNEDTEEVYAYELQYLTAQFNKQIK